MDHDQPKHINFGTHPPGHYPYVNMIPPDKLQPTDIHIVDIAHNLSLINRFAGAIPYSVAEHCLICSMMIREAVKLVETDPTKLATAQLCALLHDAHEAYIGDIIVPVANILGDTFKRQLRKLKHFVDIQIAAAVGLQQIQTLSVHVVDQQLLQYELSHFFGIADIKDQPFYEKIRNEFCCYPPEESERLYLEAYYNLMAVRAQEDDVEEVSV